MQGREDSLKVRGPEGRPEGLFRGPVGLYGPKIEVPLSLVISWTPLSWHPL